MNSQSNSTKATRKESFWSEGLYRQSLIQNETKIKSLKGQINYVSQKVDDQSLEDWEHNDYKKLLVSLEADLLDEIAEKTRLEELDSYSEF